jgi:2-oxoglutarate dehydrogenase complex dehydrogenase (E1) component-like enzyme
MGFEFGYSGTSRDSLVLWEAQFGDFANGAQVIIDQFLASSEAKWNFLSGLVLLLPHGYEGQGPEHSSARLERYLQLCAEGNMVVAYPSNAAQYFHLLRRQGLMEIKRPLVVMTPKSLLRSAAACCKSAALTDGQFETVIDENFGKETEIHSVVMVSGKVYYDVHNTLSKSGVSGVKLVRFEQLYPFPQFDIKKVLKNVKPKHCVWVQEEPQNMGAWSYIEPYLRHKLEMDPDYVGRPVSASTAAGSPKRHAYEQQKFLDELIALVKS